VCVKPGPQIHCRGRSRDDRIVTVWVAWVGCQPAVALAPSPRERKPPSARSRDDALAGRASSARETLTLGSPRGTSSDLGKRGADLPSTCAVSHWPVAGVPPNADSGNALRAARTGCDRKVRWGTARWTFNQCCLLPVSRRHRRHDGPCGAVWVGRLLGFKVCK
jgi:hypothetical protein